MHPLSPSQDCLDLIKQFEGCRLKAYRCPAGVLTCGYGATGPDIKARTVWTQKQAEERLSLDVRRFARGVWNLVGDKPITQHQFDALVSFAFNCGLANLGRSTLLIRHRAGDYAAAKAEFAKWNIGGGKVLPGLVKRRAAEAALYARD